MVIPMILAHFSQIMIDAGVVSRWTPKAAAVTVAAPPSAEESSLQSSHGPDSDMQLDTLHHGNADRLDVSVRQ